MNEKNTIDAVIAGARAELKTGAPDDAGRLQEFARWQAQQRGPLRWFRRLAAVAGTVWVLQFGFSIWVLDLFGRPKPWGAVVALLLVPLVLWGASTLAARSGLGAQLLSRSLLLATAMVGSATSVFQNATFDSQLGLGLGWSTTRILVPAVLLMGLTLGEHGLTTPRRSSDRGGFDMVLSLSLVMGLADATFLIFVAVTTFGTVSIGPWPLVLSVVLGIAGYGLFRGRVWGLLLMALANFAEVMWVIDGSLLGDSRVMGAAGGLLILTATIQLLLPAPVYVAMLAPRRKWVERLQASEASFARILTVLLAVFLLLAALGSAVALPLLVSAWEQGLLPGL